MIRSRLYLLIAAVLTFASSVSAQDRIVVTWFIGLGTGTSTEQIEVENQVVADFNASQDEIELVPWIAANYQCVCDAMETMIANGDLPDIVGPLGIAGSHRYEEIWRDLSPLIESTQYDLSAYDPALIELYRGAAGEVLGLPFAVFPSLMYYNKGIFDEEGLNYPPSAFGEDYILPDGTAVYWDYWTLSYVAAWLTVDINGNRALLDANANGMLDIEDCRSCANETDFTRRLPHPPRPQLNPDFDPSQIVQFGFNFQWATMRLMWTHLMPEDFYDEANNSVVIPESWREASLWLHDAIWENHFMPSNDYNNSEGFGNSNMFPLGKLAMAVAPIWYTCCLSESVGNFEWDFGTVPRSFDGEYHVATDIDTFYITKDSEHPEAAFTALSYLLNEGVSTLAPVYGAYPARAEYQAGYIDSLLERYPFIENTAVPAASLPYSNPGSMHHESYTPNWQEGADRLQAFSTLLFDDTGADMDVNDELDVLEMDMNAIVHQDE